MSNLIHHRSRSTALPTPRPDRTHAVLTGTAATAMSDQTRASARESQDSRKQSQDWPRQTRVSMFQTQDWKLQTQDSKFQTQD